MKDDNKPMPGEPVLEPFADVNVQADASAPQDRVEQNEQDEQSGQAGRNGQAEQANQAEQAGQRVASEDEWREALETAVGQRDEYLAMAQRVQADFQNFRRRNAQTRADGYADGVCETLGALLPVIDNLERAIKAADDMGDRSALCEGVKMTYRQFMEAAARMGLEEVPALGEKFDPELHNAVMRGEGGAGGTVLEVFQKGYRVKDRIIRYAMVKVAVE